MPRAVEWPDLEFRHAFAPFAEPDGRTVERWIPFGMPNLSQEFLKAVVTLWGPSKSGGDKAMGTGVLVAKPSERDETKAHLYVVTAKHVADVVNSIRINTNDGKSRKVDALDWAFKPDWDDIAAIDVTGLFDLKTDAYTVILWRSLLDDEFIEKHEIYAGDEGFMLGLFSSVEGKNRNFPAPRFGCLSILADKNEYIIQGNGVKRPSHVFEMHSRPGHSGSPVFIYRTPATDLSKLGASQWPTMRPENMFWKLLGIHSRQFWESAENKKAEAYGGPQPILEGDEIDMPSSMTVIVPAKQIKELLDVPKLADQRAAREASAARVKIRPEAIQADEKGPNPEHKADFMRLLGAAAKVKPQAGRT